VGAVAALTTGVALATGTGLAFVAATGSPTEAATPSARKLPARTVAVNRETLVSRQDEAGSLGFGDTTALVNRVNGTITRLAAAGSVISRGGRLYEVDEDPVVLLHGTLPAYRTLAAGVEGKDVQQFEQNLRALGYTGFTVDQEYSSATAKAVREWQEDLGLEESGKVEPGRIVYTAGPVRIFGTQLPVGAAAQPGSTVLTWSGTARVVTVELDVEDKRVARVGSKVTVTLPDGKEVAGAVSAAETVVETGEQPDAEPTTKLVVTVAVPDSKELADYDAASVTVAFLAEQRPDVLTVPVAALLALAEGGYGLEVVEGSTSRTVAVQAGLFADGRVEVSGDGLEEGDTVGVAG
jgi:peptidoglycan hydrolase-like protein with peptidoglycan-binding domain